MLNYEQLFLSLLVSTEKSCCCFVVVILRQRGKNSVKQGFYYFDKSDYL